MRKTVISLTTVGVAFVAYFAWPLYDAYVLARAIETGDAETVSDRVNFGEVRRTLVRQLIGDVVPNASPLLQGALVTVVASSDPVTKLLSPESFREMMRSGWPSSVVPGPPGQRFAPAVPSDASIATVWQIFLSSDYFMRNVEFLVPPDVPPSLQFAIGFRLAQWRWRLHSVRLPEPVRLALAQEITRLRKESGR